MDQGPSANGSAAFSFEDQMRTLILSNGLPGESRQADQTNTDAIKSTPTGYLPPHLLVASQSEQEEYLSKHKDVEKLTTPLPAKPRMKLSQAERKRGASNQLDLSKAIPELKSNDTTTSPPPVELDNNKNSKLNGISSDLQPTSTAVPPHLACFSGGVPAQTRRDAPKVDINLSRMPPQPSAGSTHSPARVYNSPQSLAKSPATSTHTQYASGPGHSQPRFSHQPAPGPHYTGHQRTFSAQPRGNYQVPMNGHLPHQSPRNFPPRTSGHNFAPPNFFPRPNGQFPLARQPPPPNRQLFNPNPQQFHPSDHQEIPVPGRMQVEYLDHLAAVEIAKAEVPEEELRAKEDFRLELHNVCQWAVASFEQKRDPSFDARTVALKCFGSLSSGFATHGSDLDLVLVSPKSAPDVASPDSEIPRLLEKVLLNEGYGARLLTRTRVPIIRLCEKPTPDLKKALLEERAKWESDRDLAAAQKLEKKQKKKEKAKAKKAKKAENTPDEATLTTPVVDLDNQETAQGASDSSSVKSDLHEDDQLPEEGDTSLSIHAQKSERQIDSNEQSNSANPSAEDIGKVIQEHEDGDSTDTLVKRQQQVTKLRESGKTAPADDNDEAVAAPEKILQDTPQLDGGEDRLTWELKKALREPPVDQTKTEKPKAPQPVRTDEEVVRLYLLAMGEGWFEDGERKIIFRFVNSFKKPNSNGTPELEEARAALSALPDVLSRYRERAQDKHLDFPKDGVGIQCDINFSNHLALHNTQLLRCYSLCDPRVRPIVLFVKAWAKKRKINSPYHGTLSSYGYVLMVLHYLINVAVPPVVPNLQLAWQASSKEFVEDQQCNGFDVRFWRAEKEIRIAARRGMLTQNRQPLGFLLRGFFQYYSQEGRGVPCGGFSWSRSVISIRTDGGLLTKQEKGWVEARTEIIEPIIAGQRPKEIKHRYLLAIEDPFELEHNVARPVPHHGICAIRDEFRRANRLTQTGGSILGVKVDMFEEGQEHIQERTFFGPNPARFTRPKRFGPQNSATPNGKAEEQHGTTNGHAAKPSPQEVNRAPAVLAKEGTLNGATSGNIHMTQAVREDEPFLGTISDAGVGSGDEELAGGDEKVAGNGGKVIHILGSPQSLNEDMRG
ncbi:hypothetical protein MMC30_000349 [Trapelia coarctata]|nr:hypothetical protein [Trapelia coarctata]